MEEVQYIGINSIPIVALMSTFIGAVISLQTASNMDSPLLPDYTVGYITQSSVILEFSPTIISLILAGKVGSNIASEIGTMRITEQIDALSTLGTRPMQYLIAPKIIASVLCLPFLVFIGNTIGILGGYTIAIFKLDFNPDLYLYATIDNLQWIDLIQGSVKAATFGLIISMVSCYFGFNASKGAEGVGYATTASVVVSSVMILTSTYVITAMFFG